MTTTIANRQAAPMTAWTPTFAMSVEQAVEQVMQKREFFERCMKEGTHYGTIPGTPKPSLWKPGAEFLLSSMGLHCEVTVKESVRDYTGRDHNGESFIEFLCTGTVFRQIGLRPEERMVVAQADGLCNSWETKYRYRDAKRKCPDCGAETIYESKKEPGWFCWRVKGGCGHEFAENDVRITGQPLGKVRNPDIADLSNTILKIGGKRSYVAAALLATGCSDIFTQDMADQDDEPRGDRSEEGNGGGQRRTQGRSNGGARSASPGVTDEQMAELRKLNEQLGVRKWSPAVLDGKAKGLGYEKVRAELEGQLGKAPDVTPPAASDESAGEPS